MARVRESAALGAVLIAVLGLEVVGLRGGTVGLILIGLLVLIAVVVLLARVDLQRIGLGAACVAAFTLTWNGLYLGPVRPGDVMIVVPLICFALANPNAAFRTPPWWVKTLVFALLLGVLLQVAFPPDPAYLAQRVVLDAGGSLVHTTGNLSLTNLFVAFKFIIAVAATPLAFAAAVRFDVRAVRWLAISFAVGAALSGAVATLDYFGAGVGAAITGLGGTSAREAGLADHPNFLAGALVIAIPFAFWLLFDHSRRLRVTGAASLLFMVFGVYASGSRGGAVTAVLVLGMCLVLQPRTRVYVANYAAAALCVVGFIAIAMPSFGASILRVTRLSGSATTEGSDTVRALVAAQGWRDYHHSPFTGIGLQASTDASLVYLQELAAGGLILFAAMLIYMGGAVWESFRLVPRSTLAGAVLAALLGTLILNFFTASLTDRFYYVPAAILVALLESRRLTGPSAQELPQERRLAEVTV